MSPHTARCAVHNSSQQSNTKPCNEGHFPHPATQETPPWGHCTLAGSSPVPCVSAWWKPHHLSTASLTSTQAPQGLLPPPFLCLLCWILQVLHGFVPGNLFFLPVPHYHRLRVVLQCLRALNNHSSGGEVAHQPRGCCTQCRWAFAHKFEQGAELGLVMERGLEMGPWNWGAKM